MIAAVEKDAVPRKRRVISQVSQACIRCRQKKIKCSGEKPSCQACSNNKVECIWPDRPNMRGKKPSSAARTLSPLTGIVQPYLGSHPFSPTLLSPSSPNMDFTYSINSFGDYQKQLRLPTSRKLLQLWDIFLKTSYTELFGIFNKAQITSQIASDTAPPVLVLCICAHAARFSQEEVNRFKSSTAASDYYANQAFSLLPCRFQDISLTNITCLLLLCLIELGSCRGAKAWLLLGMALRMVDSLDLGNEINDNPLTMGSNTVLWTEAEQKRRVYWACFFVERLLSTGYMAPSKLRSLSLSLQKTSIQLPCPESNFLFNQPILTELFDGSLPENTQSDTTSMAPYQRSLQLEFMTGPLIRLSNLWSEISRWALCGGYTKDITPPWLNQSQFHRSFELLKAWHENLPPRAVWSYTNYSAYSSPGESAGACYTFMHLLYHTTLAYLLRNVLDLFPEKSRQKSKLFSSVSQRFGQQPPTVWMDMILDQVITSADFITKLSKDPLNYIMSPFVGFSILTAATIHMLLKFCVVNIDQNYISSSRLVHVDHQILQDRSKYWKINQAMLVTLQRLYNFYRFQYLEEQSLYNFKIPGFPLCILEYGIVEDQSMKSNPDLNSFSKELFSRGTNELLNNGDDTQSGNSTPAMGVSEIRTDTILDEEVPVDPLITSILDDGRWWEEMFGSERKAGFKETVFEDMNGRSIRL